MEDVKYFEGIYILDASVYEQLIVHINSVYQDSSGRQAARTQETMMFMERRKSSG